RKLKSEYAVYAKALIKDPMHARLKSFVTMVQSDPTPLAYAALAMSGGTVPAEEVELRPEAAIAAAWARDPENFRSMLSNKMLQALPGPGRRFDFLGPDLPEIPEWHFDFRPFEHLKVSGGEDGGLRVSGADVFSIFTDIPVISNMNYLLDV